MEHPIYHQIAALPYRRQKKGIEVLLITSRETKRWVIPKGWPMEGKTDYEAAKTEAFEEAGIDGRIDHTPLGHFDYQKRLKSGDTKFVRVQVYGLHVSELKRNWPEKHQRKRKWFSPANAAQLVAEAQLKEIISAL